MEETMIRTTSLSLSSQLPGTYQEVGLLMEMEETLLLKDKDLRMKATQSVNWMAPFINQHLLSGMRSDALCQEHKEAIHILEMLLSQLLPTEKIGTTLLEDSSITNSLL